MSWFFVCGNQDTAIAGHDRLGLYSQARWIKVFFFCMIIMLIRINIGLVCLMYVFFWVVNNILIPWFFLGAISLQTSKYSVVVSELDINLIFYLVLIKYVLCLCYNRKGSNILIHCLWQLGWNLVSVILLCYVTWRQFSGLSSAREVCTTYLSSGDRKALTSLLGVTRKFSKYYSIMLCYLKLI